ncbi:MAG: hypothetical protein ABIP13_00175, partial [Tepidiformaceae bacterium]
MTPKVDGSWHPLLGAIPRVGGGTRFQVWAPKPATIELLWYDDAGEHVAELLLLPGGYRTAEV